MTAAGVRLVWALCGSIVVTPAWGAFGNDNLQLRAGAHLRYEDNVQRLPDGVSAVTPGGSLSRSDVIRTLNAGISYAVPVSRQQFLFSLDLNQTHYAKFSNLDFDGQDVRGTWRWELGRFLTGEAGLIRTKYQPGFANIVTPTVTPSIIGAGPNVRTSTQQFFTANYPFHANFAANVSLNEGRFTNSDAANKIGDNDTSTRSVGLRYISPLQNYVGIQATTGETRFTTLQAVGGRLFDNSYDQNTLALVAGWAPGAASMLTGSVGRTTRDFHQPGRGQTHGTVASLLFNWRPTGRTTLNLELSQDLSPPNDIITAGSQARTFAILPSWSATGKTTVLGNFRRQVRDYTTAVFAVPGGAREDTLTNFGAAVVYIPIRNVLVNVGVQHEKRESTAPGFDFNANIYSATVQWSF
jgi:exopolysaccharide biosynthesis operon protein EpsL